MCLWFTTSYYYSCLSWGSWNNPRDRDTRQHRGIQHLRKQLAWSGLLATCKCWSLWIQVDSKRPGDLNTELQCYEFQKVLLPQTQLSLYMWCQIAYSIANELICCWSVSLEYVYYKPVIASGRISLDSVQITLTLQRWCFFHLAFLC